MSGSLFKRKRVVYDHGKPEHCKPKSSLDEGKRIKPSNAYCMRENGEKKKTKQIDTPVFAESF